MRLALIVSRLQVEQTMLHLIINKEIISWVVHFNDFANNVLTIKKIKLT